MYQSKIEDQQYELGTSGFLYRSNKLMYDQETKSLWSTLQGEPVVGSLVGQGIKLPRHSVVTTTWGDWKRQHPKTTVLSILTGHRRDYGEGVAYADYFGTDELMFGVPKLDNRLKNKDEIFALRDNEHQLALSARYLSETPVHHDKLGEKRFVVLTNDAGGNRAYDAGDTTFVSWNGVGEAVDDAGQTWTVNEDQLALGDRTLERLPAHRAFWFGWYSQFPDTRLVR